MQQIQFQHSYGKSTIVWTIIPTYSSCPVYPIQFLLISAWIHKISHQFAGGLRIELCIQLKAKGYICIWMCIQIQITVCSFMLSIFLVNSCSIKTGQISPVKLRKQAINYSTISQSLHFTFAFKSFIVFQNDIGLQPSVGNLLSPNGNLNSLPQSHEQSSIWGKNPQNASNIQLTYFPALRSVFLAAVALM